MLIIGTSTQTHPPAQRKDGRSVLATTYKVYTQILVKSNEGFLMKELRKEQTESSGEDKREQRMLLVQ